MRKRTQATALRALGVWQERLRLSEWEIEVKFGGDHDEANASIYTSHDYQRATVTLYDGWQTCDDKTFNRTLIHELLHITTHGMRNAQKSILYKGMLTRREEEMFEDRFEHEWERAVENLSWVIYDGFGPA